MSFLDYLERRADRKDARRLLLIEQGLDARSLMRSACGGVDPRFLIALTIIGLFAWAFLQAADDKDTRNLMVGAVIAAFAGAWGYYLGSSSSASAAGARTDVALDLASRALPVPPTGDDIQLEPGERKVVTGVDGGGKD